MAWHRPDQFRKVISTIGSFTNIMGGHVYPDLIRQSEPKPIRIFLQDGVNDNRGLSPAVATYDPTRDWHAQNIKMVEAPDGEEIRRELHLGHRHPFQQAGRGDHARNAPLALARLSATGRSQRPRQPIVAGSD